MITKEIKLLGVVITYCPELENLCANINSYIDDLDKLIVWNNTPELSNEELKHNLENNGILSHKITILGEGENRFIAYPLNRALDYGVQNSFTHLLTLDQDSQFDQGGLRLLKDYVIKYGFAISGVNPNNRYSSDVEYHELLTVITSGTVYDINVLTSVGNFNEEYGIDSVDYEICFKFLYKGHKTFLFPKVNLNHVFGEPVKAFGLFTASNHSPFRLYQICRNQIRLKNTYPDFFKREFPNFYQNHILKRIVKIILSEKQKLKKISSIIKGVCDGLKSQQF